MSGRPVFNNEKVMARIAEIGKEEALKTGRFLFTWNDAESKDRISEYSFHGEKQGFLRIYREPEAYVPYVIGADTKGEGKDFFAATVIDNRTGERVAALDVYKRQAWDKTAELIGKWFSKGKEILLTGSVKVSKYETCLLYTSFSTDVSRRHFSPPHTR